MLGRAGLDRARLFVVEERRLEAGRLPDDQVAPLRDWLHALAADAEARVAVVRQTLDGALDSLTAPGRHGRRGGRRAGRRGRRRCTPSPTRRTPARARRRRRRALRAPCCAARCSPAGRTSSARASGCAASSRGSAGCATGCRPPSPAAAAAGEDVTGALETSVESLLRAAADRAAERTVTAWRGTAGRRRAARRARPRARPGLAGVRRRRPSARCGPGRAGCWSWSRSRARTSARPPGRCRSASTARGSP